MRLRMLLVIGCCLLPGWVLADIMFPPVVDMALNPVYGCIINPLLYPVFLLFIAWLETVTIKRYIVHDTFKGAFWSIFWINIATCLLRVPLIDLKHRWLYFAAAYLGTILVEGGLLMIVRKRFGITSIWKAFGLSSLMNTASYAVLAAALASMLYLPGLGKEDLAVKRGVRGIIICESSYSYYYGIIDTRTNSLHQMARPEGLEYSFFYPWDDSTVYFVANDRINFYDPQAGKILRSEHMTVRHDMSIDRISHDRRWLYGYKKDSLILYDQQRRTYQTLYKNTVDCIPSAEFSSDSRWISTTIWTEHQMKNTNWSVSKPTSQIIDLHTGQIIKLNTASEIRFNHTATFAAWINKKYLTIYEMNSGRQRVLPVPDNQETAFAWSPDDRYIAYLGEVNPFTSWSDTKDIRVIDLQTGKSATLIDGITMRGIHNYLLWLP